MQTFLKNGYIVSMDQNDTVFDGGGVLVENDRITAVGPGRPGEDLARRGGYRPARKICSARICEYPRPHLAADIPRCRRRCGFYLLAARENVAL